MLPKEIRDKKAFAKVCSRETKRIVKRMDDYLNSSDHKSIEIAEAFYRVLAWHIAEGDLQPENVHLTSLLRKTE
jgi:hypothetical protein